MQLDKLRSYATALELEKKGFWLSEEQDRQARAEAANAASCRIKSAFNDALNTATAQRNFQVLVDGLVTGIEPDTPLSEEEERWLTNGFTWRFSLMPYGRGSEDARGFPVAEGEEKGDAYQFMDAGDYGDYIDRKDSKCEPIRKARHLFASAYIPPTK